jgi:hypothetical protein
VIEFYDNNQLFCKQHAIKSRIKNSVIAILKTLVNDFCGQKRKHGFLYICKKSGKKGLKIICPGLKEPIEIPTFNNIY